MQIEILKNQLLVGTDPSAEKGRRRGFPFLGDFATSTRGCETDEIFSPRQARPAVKAEGRRAPTTPSTASSRWGARRFRWPRPCRLPPTQCIMGAKRPSTLILELTAPGNQMKKKQAKVYSPCRLHLNSLAITSLDTSPLHPAPVRLPRDVLTLVR